MDLYSFAIRNRRCFMNLKEPGLVLDVGCGPNSHEDNLNVDYYWRPGIDICCDVTKQLPIADNYCCGIFSEHCIEHVTFNEARDLLREFFRVLAPGAYCRIILPDLEIYVNRYVTIRDGNLGQMPHGKNDYVDGIYCSAIDFNRIMHEHGHRFIYDFNTISALLRAAGFVDIKKSSYGSGPQQNLILDTEYRAVESLYVDCRKPA